MRSDEMSEVNSRYQVPVAVKHRVEPMCNCQHRAVGKLAAYCCLNELVRFHVDRSRSLVQHEDGSLAEKGACQTYELALADADTPQCNNTNTCTG